MEQTINQRFKIFLAKENLSQTKVAEVLQCTKQAVSLMANGKQSITIQHAVLLERNFNLSTTWLLTGAGPMIFEHNLVPVEKISVPLEMWNELKRDLDFFRSLCAKQAGLNFSNGSLIRKQDYKAAEAVQTQLHFPVTAQLTLLMNDTKLSAIA